jgi:hypothetical protein
MAIVTPKPPALDGRIARGARGGDEFENPGARFCVETAGVGQRKRIRTR